MGMKRKIQRTNEPEAKLIWEAYEEFEAEKVAKNLSLSTMKNYHQSLEYFMEFHGLDESATFEGITASHFFKWINTMKLQGVKHTSINHYLRDVRAFFYWCMDSTREYLPSFKIIMIEGQEEAPKLFTDDELQTLLIKPHKGDSFIVWRTWAIVNWVLATGNRAATICDVKVSDINYAKKEITLAHTKNKKAQIIPLSSSLETVLKEYCRKFQISYWLFPNVGDEKLTTNALAHAFSRYCKDRGVERTNIHGLRHNFAKLWIRNNGNEFQLQQILGHSTLDMTRHYVKLFAEDLKEDFDKFNPLDTIKKSSKRTQAIKRIDD